MVEDRRFLLALMQIEGIGGGSLRRIAKHFSSWQKAWEGSQDELEACLGRRVDWSRRSQVDPDSLWKSLLKVGAFMIVEGEEDYPLLLREIPRLPFVLFGRGNKSLLNNMSLAVVGPRRCSRYGKLVVDRLVPGLVGAGLTIVSGLAMGVDSLAHRVALETKGGLTIGVLGSGIDSITPISSRLLGQRMIAEGHLILSEYGPGVKAQPGFFPMRNRIVSGLSLGTLVVEAGQKSGSLITAQLALEQNREVFAVPGDITLSGNVGTHGLIQKGAKLVTKVADVLDELDIGRRKKQVMARENLVVSGVEGDVLKLLEGQVLHMDDIIRGLQRNAAEVLPLLTMMEMKGQIISRGGGAYGLP